jgi:trk system potassium uptake protein TrkH
MKTLRALPLFVILMGVASFSMLGPAIYALALDQHRVAQPFFYGAILFGLLTGLLGLTTMNRVSRRPARDQLLTLLAAFALLPVMLAVPMYEAVRDMSFFNAYFEMVSSMTTTGATLFDTPGRISEPIHIWRAMVGWMGGFLTLVTAIAILAPMNLAGFEVLRPMGGSDAVERAIAASDPSIRVFRFAGRLFPIYLAATLLLWFGLAVFGTPAYPAAMLAMSTLATSGIVPEGGLADLNIGVGAEMFIFVFLILSVSRQTLMNDFNRSLLGRLKADREVRLATGFVVLVPLFLFLRHWIGALEVNYETDVIAGARALWGSVFSVLSFMTTTGFVSADWGAAQSWSGLPTPGLIFAGLAIIGGGVATTAGGVKLLRVYALYKHGTREMERLVHPSSIGSAGVLGRNVRRQGAVIAWLFFMLFAISIAVITVILTFTGIDFERATIFAISALSNTGPLVEVGLEDGAGYTDLRTLGKSVLLAAMILGRLETLAIIALFNPDFWRR